MVCATELLSMSPKTLCFSGPRPGKLPDAGEDASDFMAGLKRELEKAVTEAVREGNTVFLNGCMAGFDVVAGEIVLKLKELFPNIYCVTIAPFRVNFFGNLNWDGLWKQRALTLYKKSDVALCLSESYHPKVYYERNEFLVDHASGVICYYTGTAGGTKYTLNYARKKGKKLINLANEAFPCAD